MFEIYPINASRRIIQHITGYFHVDKATVLAVVVIRSFQELTLPNLISSAAGIPI